MSPKFLYPHGEVILSTDAPHPADGNPFHIAHWPRSIAVPGDYTGGERLCVSYDLGAVAEAEKKKVLAAWCAALPTMSELRWLNLWSHVTQPLFDAACRLAGLECLVVKWSNVRRLDAITALGDLEYLFIGSSTKVESIEPLTRLPALRVLHIENFKQLSDFSAVARLTSLESLTIAGSMWTRQKVDSLEPLAGMTWLKSLAVDTAHVDTLRPLANMTSLETLGLGGRLPMSEYAWLAARLPHTQCRWFAPFLELANTGIGRCKRCGAQSMVMLTGRGKGTVCRNCDAAKVANHVAAFEEVRAASVAG